MNTFKYGSGSLAAALELLCVFALSAQTQHPIYDWAPKAKVSVSPNASFSICDRDLVIWPSDAPDSVVRSFINYSTPHGALLMEPNGSGTYHDGALLSADGDCLVLVEFRYGGGEKYDGSDPRVEELNSHLLYARIKKDMRYGLPYSNPDDVEIEELSTLLHIYPKRTGKRLFGADLLVSYPKSLMERKYDGRFTRCRVVTAAKGNRQIIMDFLMTDESSRRYDEYLYGLKGVFTMRDAPEVSPEAQGLNNVAVSVLKGSRDYVRMNALLDSAIMIQPDYRAAYANKLTALIGMRDIPALQPVLKKLASLDSDNLSALTQLGMYYDYTGDHFRAEKLYRKVEKKALRQMSKSPGDFACLSSLWMVQFLRGEDSEREKTEQRMRDSSTTEYSLLSRFMEESIRRGKEGFISSIFNPN